MSLIEGEITAEVLRADDRYGPFTSTHEGIGVLSEEYDELRAAVHGNDLVAVRREAIQVAAVAIRIASSMDNPSTVNRSLP